MSARQGRWWLTQDSVQVVIHATPHHLYNLIADLRFTSLRDQRS